LTKTPLIDIISFGNLEYVWGAKSTKTPVATGPTNLVTAGTKSPTKTTWITRGPVLKIVYHLTMT